MSRSHQKHHGCQEGSSYSNHDNYNGSQRPSYSQNIEYPQSSSGYNDIHILPPPRPVIAAYGQDDRKVPNGFMMNEFQQTSVERMELVSVARRQEEQLKKMQMQLEKMKRKVEETSVHSIKKVTLDSGSDDNDLFPAPGPTVNVEKENSLEKRKRHREKRKKHKKHRNHRELLSGESSSSSSSCSHSQERRKEKKKHKSSKKKKRSDSPCQTRAEPNFPVVGMFHVSVNPWSLLKERDYTYKNTHFVLDERADPQNLNFDEVYKHHKAGHKTLSHALSNTFDMIQLEVPKEAAAFDKCRFFNRDNMKRWNKPQVEREFRKEEPIDVAGVSRVPLSLAPLPVDEIANMKKLVFAENMRSIDLDVYENLKASTQMSYEESDLDGKHELLKARCNAQNTYRDVDSWIDFANIQDQIIARDEHGDPTQEVTNKQALFERKSEILKQAIRRVGRKVELELELLRIMEEFYGVDSIEVQKKWFDMEKTFISSLKMWKLKIKMRQNNRTSFKLESLLSLIDRCIAKLVSIRVGDVLTHKPEPNTDEFLVDMVVQRTKLLIECGFIDRAIACLQAVATFQFLNHKVTCKDSKPKDSFARLHGLFKTFWEICPPRIGEQGAKNIPGSDYTPTVDAETKMLAEEREEIRTKEDELISQCKQNNSSDSEIWRLVEALRSQLFWRPVRNVALPEEYYDYPSRNVAFDVVSPILFPLLDRNLAFQFVFQLLQLFGAVIPGMELNSQEEVLEKFSPNLFPSFPLNLHKFSDFLDNFFALFLTVEGVDKLRVLSAKFLSRAYLDIIHSDLSKKEKKRRLNGLVAGPDGVNDLKIISEIERQLLIYQISELYDVIDPEKEHTKVIQFAECRFCNIAHDNIWTMADSRERLLHLKLAQTFCRRLPFSDDCGVGPNTLTKKKFLTCLGVNGNAQAIEYNSHNEKAAIHNWMMRTSLVKQESQQAANQTDLWWFANEDEIILELASTFSYEVAPGAVQNKLHQFDSVFQKSKLAKAVGLSAAVLKHKFHIYRHHMKRSANVSPKNLVTHLIHSMQRFPHKVSFVKNFLALSNTFNARYFLQTNPGNGNFRDHISVFYGRIAKSNSSLPKHLGTVYTLELTEVEKSTKISHELTKRVRSCAKVFLEWKNFLQAENAESRASALEMLCKVIEAAAAEETNTSMPDAYLWCLLLYVEHQDGSSKQLDEVFNLGQKQCPWSKQFLLESARNRPSSSDHLTVIDNISGNAGIQLYCNPLIEVPMLLKVDVFAERSEFD